MWRFVFLFAVVLGIDRGESELFYDFPKFWTNTGFCPPGEITHKGISESLLTKEVKTNLHLIGSLPNGALSTVRIHWLLELITLNGFDDHIPNYDFSKLDELVWWLDRRGLALGFELMGNPSGIFTKNASISDYLWEDLVFQIGKRYLNRLGPTKLSKWRFESWNEPDLMKYNTLNFDLEKFQSYLIAVRRGLNAATRRPMNTIHLKLYGPAGLFKDEKIHRLCWGALEKCNTNPKRCPFQTITFHHKGASNGDDVAAGGTQLVREIFEKYPNLTTMPVANDEADPISGWSTPRDFQADVRYAAEVILIIFNHWKAKLDTQAFANLDFISHDNAFISYHPHEFTQRTLFAHFRMNNTNPAYSHFIQKPVYAALGMLGSLGEHAADIEDTEEGVQILKTCDVNCTSFFNLVAVSVSEEWFKKRIFVESMAGKLFSCVVEYLEYQSTDPFHVWKFYGSPAYPNATVSQAMRLHAGPALFTVRMFSKPLIYVDIRLRSPWIIQIRICADTVPPPERPKKVQITTINKHELLILWNEKHQPRRCTLTYQVWFQPANATDWQEITEGWHVPFLSFHFAPKNRILKGTYRVRSIDSFGRFSNFSKPKHYV